MTRVLFEGDRATGVEYERDGRRVSVSATAEVLLCAGTVESPKLLKLSGVGPADELARHGITCRVDLPGVGDNLQDHVQAAVGYDCTESVSYPPGSNGIENTAFERTAPGLPAPDVQYILWATEARLDTEAESRLLITAIVLRPHSRGRITLRSDDPFDPPVIDPQYLSDARDLETLVSGVTRAREIMRASALDPYRGDEFSPGDVVRTDDGMAAYVREHASTIYHPVGTCKMGHDSLAVVDDRLRVHGLEGLRIVDASIMPRVTSGNTNAPTIAIAERAAELIVGEA